MTKRQARRRAKGVAAILIDNFLASGGAEYWEGRESERDIRRIEEALDVLREQLRGRTIQEER